MNKTTTTFPPDPAPDFNSWMQHISTTLNGMIKASTVIIVLIAFSLTSFAQYDCDNFPAATVSYVLPKTISVGVDYFTEKGITAAIGGAYTSPKTYAVKQGANTFDSTGNAFDLYAYVGYRVARIDYSVSVFLNAGYTMGDKYEAKPVISSKILFPVNNHAFSVEPFYIFGRGFSGKLSAHFRF